jgi:type 1 glutamine amidotransferase
MFYTTGNLMEVGKDGHPAMTAEGKQALLDYVKSGKGFVGSHSASDTFHTNNEAIKGPDRFRNFGDAVDPYVKVLGAEFIRHGAQQEAKNRVVDNKFPGFENLGSEYSMMEEWYSLKDFREDIHVLSVIDSAAMKGKEYERPPFPTTWARKEGEGRVFYTAMGHREDVWTNPIFRSILVGGLKWAMKDAEADITPNLKEVAPGAMQNPAYFETPPPAVKKKPEDKPQQPATSEPGKKAA